MTLEKTSAGLGFSLEGGKGSLHGDKPLTVNRIFKGTVHVWLFSPACGVEVTFLVPLSTVEVFFSLIPGAASEQRDTVQPGDEILHLAGTAVQGLTRFEAWNVIKALPDGPVTVLIRRKSPQAEGTPAAGSP